MFTGIIESLGKILKIESQRSVHGGKSLFFSIQSKFKSLSPGESVAVDGVCLTVLKKKSHQGSLIFSVEVSEETLEKTTLRKMDVGKEVNLERSLKVGSRLGGHFVYGHVDATGEIAGIVPQGNSKIFTFSHPSSLAAWIVTKGSVAIDGISLTVAEVQEGSFSVVALPFTDRMTNLRGKKIKDAINIETDMLAKIMAQQLAQRSGNELK